MIECTLVGNHVLDTWTCTKPQWQNETGRLLDCFFFLHKSAAWPCVQLHVLSFTVNLAWKWSYKSAKTSESINAKMIGLICWNDSFHILLFRSSAPLLVPKWKRDEISKKYLYCECNNFIMMNLSSSASLDPTNFIFYDFGVHKIELRETSQTLLLVFLPQSKSQNMADDDCPNTYVLVETPHWVHPSLQNAATIGWSKTEYNFLQKLTTIPTHSSKQMLWCFLFQHALWKELNIFNCFLL